MTTYTLSLYDPHFVTADSPRDPEPTSRWQDDGDASGRIVTEKITVDTDALFSPVDRFESDDIAFRVKALLSYLPLTVQSLTSKCVLIFEPQLDESVAITLDTHPTSFAAEDVAFPSPFPNLNEYIQLSSDAATITGVQTAATHFID